MSIKPTDWDRYYKSTSPVTRITRSITTRRVCRTVAAWSGAGPFDVCELGGANSCVAAGLVNALPVRSYHVIDTNQYGLELLRSACIQPLITTENTDITAAPKHATGGYDIVLSVGLVEHFDEVGTATAIRAHFERARPGGLVLITFPTPTLPYLVLRGLLEVTGNWIFSDERPLGFAEVLGVCSQHGEVVHTSRNWLIGLTQGYVVVRVPVE